MMRRERRRRVSLPFTKTFTRTTIAITTTGEAALINVIISGGKGSNRGDGVVAADEHDVSGSEVIIGQKRS